jgi:hypothetical protein
MALGGRWSGGQGGKTAEVWTGERLGATDETYRRLPLSGLIRRASIEAITIYGFFNAQWRVVFMPDLALRCTGLLRAVRPAPIGLWAALAEEDTPRMQEFFGKAGGPDYSTQMHILDRQGRLIWRTFELPTAEESVGIVRKV